MTLEVWTALDELGHSMARALELAWKIDSGECATTGQLFAAYDERVTEIRQMKRMIGAV